MPKPGKKLENMERFEKTGCLRQASLFAQGSRNNGGFDIEGSTGFSKIQGLHMRKTHQVTSCRCGRPVKAVVGLSQTSSLGQVCRDSNEMDCIKTPI